MSTDPHIQAALAYKEKHGLTSKESADALGVSRKTIERWKAGAENIRSTSTRREIERVCMGKVKPRTQTLRAATDPPVMTPIVGLARAASFDPAIDSIGEFLASFGTHHAWSSAKPGYMTVVVAGNSMEPEYPDGTLLLVAPDEHPQRGDIVVASLTNTEEAVVKQYHRKDNVIYLRSLNQAVGEDYAIDVKKEQGRIQWLWPVVRIELSPRQQRWARTRAS